MPVPYIITNCPWKILLTHGLGNDWGSSASNFNFSLSTVSVSSSSLLPHISHSFQPGSISQPICIVPTRLHSWHRNLFMSSILWFKCTSPRIWGAMWKGRILEHMTISHLASCSLFLSPFHLSFLLLQNQINPTNPLFFSPQTILFSPRPLRVSLASQWLKKYSFQTHPREHLVNNTLSQTNHSYVFFFLSLQSVLIRVIVV